MRDDALQRRMLTAGTPSSSEEERDDRIRLNRDDEVFSTPWSAKRVGNKFSFNTPLTAMVTPMTPSPINTPDRPLFSDVQQGYLDTPNELDSKVLFGDMPQSDRRRKSRPSHSSRLSQSLLLDDPRKIGMSRRTSREFRASPDSSVDRQDPSPIRVDSKQPQQQGSLSWMLTWAFFAAVALSSVGMILLTPYDPIQYEPIRPEVPSSAAGLRGKMVQGHWEEISKRKESHNKGKKHDEKQRIADIHAKYKKKAVKTRAEKEGLTAKTGTEGGKNIPAVEFYSKPPTVLPVHLPESPISESKKRKFDTQDSSLYAKSGSSLKRVVALDPSMSLAHRKVKQYPADFTDNTQLYSILESSDERLSRMEIREPYSDGECVPMQDWQTTYNPSCNGMHELAMEALGETDDTDFKLFGTKGFWRHAWRVDNKDDTVVLKTLKYQHNFEDAHFEHDRVDAIAMERLTSSPHVINIFGFCGHSVMTEYADGSRVGELADKAKKKPLDRLRIARDIANGLADVHGIDGDGNATFVHLDINPANVVSVGGTLKLNDFNIGIIRRWNTTSQTPCGFPAQYPNPQWRSPEEARNEQNLTEKVDVFSMGHIFFRLICGHEPWNKLEPGGKPAKEKVNEKVQRGVLPFIPEHVQNSENPEVIAIRDAMLSCYTFDPLQRPSARDIATSLDSTLESLTKTNALAGKDGKKTKSKDNARDNKRR